MKIYCSITDYFFCVLNKKMESQHKRNYVKRKRSINECTKQIFNTLTLIQSKKGQNINEKNLNDLAIQYAKTIEASCWSRKAKYSDDEFQIITKEKTNELCTTLLRNSGLNFDSNSINMIYNFQTFNQIISTNNIQQNIKYGSHSEEEEEKIVPSDINLNFVSNSKIDPLLSIPIKHFPPSLQNPIKNINNILNISDNNFNKSSSQILLPSVSKLINQNNDEIFSLLWKPNNEPLNSKQQLTKQFYL